MSRTPTTTSLYDGPNWTPNAGGRGGGNSMMNTTMDGNSMGDTMGMGDTPPIHRHKWFKIWLWVVVVLMLGGAGFLIYYYVFRDKPTSTPPVTNNPVYVTGPTRSPSTYAPATFAPSTYAPATFAPSTYAPGTVAPGTQAPTSTYRVPSSAAEIRASLNRLYGTRTPAPTTRAKATLAATAMTPKPMKKKTKRPTKKASKRPNKVFSGQVQGAAYVEVQGPRHRRMMRRRAPQTRGYVFFD